MKKFNLRYSSVALSMAAMTAFAPTNTYAQDEFEEIVVTGTRATIQSSIDQKRIATEIVDGLSAEEIGDIPALSIGEALETLTGVSSNRENGGASEIAIRGLGSFLTNTTLNGREATNGAGNRAVNFSIFPSELFNKIGVFKTQSASAIEGAVAGQVRLETKRPIDHGKQSIVLSAKGVFAEGEDDVRGGQDIGYRGTVSYIDQFETEKYGNFGISLGGQLRDEASPEEEFTRSNTPRVCDLDNATGLPRLDTPSGEVCQNDESFLRGATTNVSDNNPSGDLLDTGEFANDLDRESFAFLSSSAQFRQNVSDDERSSGFAAFQWQPNEKLDLNLDLQFAERNQDERRSDLLFAELNRNLGNENTVIEGGSLIEFQNVSIFDTTGGDAGQENGGQEIQLLGQDFSRDEEYNAIGFNLEYQVNEDLEVSFDVAYSNTERVEQEESLRLGDEVERLVGGDFSASNDVGEFTVQNTSTNFANQGDAFIASNLGEFLRGATASGVGTTLADIQAARAVDGDFDDRIRFRSQEDIRENTITSVRGDFELQTSDKLGAISSVQGGIRFSQLEYERRGNINNDINLNDGAFQSDDIRDQLLVDIANNCIDESFDDNFEEVSSSQNDQFLNFNSIDAGCSFDFLNGAITANELELDTSPSTDFNSGSIDVEEDTFAAYLQANYESTLFGLPARGNFGVRLVNTNVDSRTFRSAFEIDNNNGGDTFELDPASAQETLDAIAASTDFETEVNDEFSYTELLPSATLVLDLSDNVLLRTGVFRGISRSDPAILGERQQVGSVEQPVVGNVETADVQSFLSGQTQTGGTAELQPFTSWNVDLALEWYPNKDTILAAGVYYKKFRGGFENAVTEQEFLVVDQGGTINPLVGDNGIVTANVSSLQTTNESSNLYGFELTASHAFSYLPGFLGGFGTKLSYNYASSDFEFEDDFAGEGVGVGVDGSPVDLVGLIPSQDIFGLSRNVASAQIYWSGGAFDAQLTGKHRSQYFQQFVDNPGRIRLVDDSTVLDFKASYKVTDAVKISFEALNITDELRTDFRGLEDNVAQVLSFGPRYFIGIQAKL